MKLLKKSAGLLNVQTLLFHPGRKWFPWVTLLHFGKCRENTFKLRLCFNYLSIILFFYELIMQRCVPLLYKRVIRSDKLKRLIIIIFFNPIFGFQLPAQSLYSVHLKIKTVYNKKVPHKIHRRRLSTLYIKNRCY